MKQKIQLYTFYLNCNDYFVLWTWTKINTLYLNYNGRLVLFNISIYIYTTVICCFLWLEWKTFCFQIWQLLSWTLFIRKLLRVSQCRGIKSHSELFKLNKVCLEESIRRYYSNICSEVSYQSRMNSVLYYEKIYLFRFIQLLWWCRFATQTAKGWHVSENLL